MFQESEDQNKIKVKKYTSFGQVDKKLEKWQNIFRQDQDNFMHLIKKLHKKKKFQVQDMPAIFRTLIYISLLQKKTFQCTK